jgi:hypothetical protein
VHAIRKLREKKSLKRRSLFSEEEKSGRFREPNEKERGKKEKKNLQTYKITSVIQLIHRLFHTLWIKL